ncbi:MAG TPA: HAD family hydrolase [Kiritimatiellia bacterium]|nr:HAD family hydrolase [Kiritimatiellia bacterium]HMO98459.1 HAD family hydrolase [Kiritimatiellia bacterium]HMP96529.1 HAD family hydrolase [Kiritimatiellia bacterium]
MKYTAAIFDLDGTLIDSIRDIAESMNRTLEAMGFPAHPVDAFRYFIGDGVTLLVQRALPPEVRESPEVLEQFLAAYRRDYLAHWRVHTRPYSGIPDLLARLVQEGVALGVLSNKPDRATQLCVEHFFPDIPFISVSGQKEDVPRKPDPTAALAMAESMNTAPARCVFIGDTATDMQTATAAGMFPAGVTWGFRGETELIESGARLIAHVPQALEGLFTP